MVAMQRLHVDFGEATINMSSDDTTTSCKITTGSKTIYATRLDLDRTYLQCTISEFDSQPTPKTVLYM